MLSKIAIVVIAIVAGILVSGEVYLYQKAGKLGPCEAAEVLLARDGWNASDRQKVIETGPLFCFPVALLLDTPFGPDNPGTLFNKRERQP